MPYEFTKLTPNLLVADVERSIAFYRDVLGFTLVTTVPDASPFVFAIVQKGGVEIFLNLAGPAIEEYPAFKDQPIGGTLTLFIETVAVRALHDALQGKAPVVMKLEKKWYGPTEFAVTDPDGYIITFAEVEK
jgi:catechol 2,3-dioxygenase-like lactoylglutathione lyase family enzyme